MKKSKRKKRDPLKHSDQVRTRREFIDYDYIDKLSIEDRNFIAKFTDEYYGGAIKKGDKSAIHYNQLQKKVNNVNSDYSEDDLEKDYDRLRKDCYNRNNEISRCQYNLAKTTGKTKEIIEAITVINDIYNGNDYENFNIIVNDRIDKISLKTLSDKEKKNLAEEIGINIDNLTDKDIKKYLIEQIRIFCNNS